MRDSGIAGYCVPGLFSAVVNVPGPGGRENNEKKIAFRFEIYLLDFM